MWLRNERCGKYELLEKLASGGMADVYLARSVTVTGLSKFVAIKRIQPQHSKDRLFVNMFKEEALIAIGLKHNNIISTLDFGFENDQYFLVMDYVEGISLRNLFSEIKKENKFLTIEQSLFLIREVASGLEYAHQSNDPTSGKPLHLTHRDLSPQNVMISYQGDIKLIDFGIAKKSSVEKQGTSTGELRGKFRYMSPEQAECEELDKRSDLFSLGIILWELLANDRLYEDISDVKILLKIKNGEIPPICKINPFVPPELGQIVNKALAKDRNLRYQTAGDLCRDLSKYLNQKFPDFTQHEFNKFISDFLKKPYSDHRKKLIKYAQTKSNPSSDLMVLETKSGEEYGTSEESNVWSQRSITQNKQKPLVDMPEGFGEIPAADSSPGKNINFDKLFEEGLISEAEKARNIEKDEFAFVKQNNVGLKTKTSNTHARKVPSTVISDSILDNIIKYAMISLVFAICFYTLEKYISPSVRNYLNSATRTTPLTNKFSLDAEISLATAPVTTNNLNRTSSLIEKIKLTKIGYINILVLNNSPHVKIAINGKYLLEKPPIYMFPVSADKKTVVSAFDPFTKKFAETALTVGVGKFIDVPITLKSVGK